MQNAALLEKYYEASIKLSANSVCRLASSAYIISHIQIRQEKPITYSFQSAYIRVSCLHFPAGS